MNSGATFSEDRVFRYRLWRTWAEGMPRTLVVIGLNPSTADETMNDPTIRRCIQFAKREGCGSLVMLNLFAFRATDPVALRRRYVAGWDCVGPLNDSAIIDACTLPQVVVVAAWGGLGKLGGRDEQVLKILRARGVRVHCLGLTKLDTPRHPLYLPHTAPLEVLPV